MRFVEKKRFITDYYNYALKKEKQEEKKILINNN